MKLFLNIIGLLLTTLGAYIYQFGFRLMDDELQAKYAVAFAEKVKEHSA